ncbi:MAG: serine hydrolase [Bacteroidia bacterium]|nr:serine hydrolase [Bacteroidia bacterium]
MKVLTLFLSLIFCLPLAFAQDAKLDISRLEPQIDSLVKQYVDLDIFSGIVLVADQGKEVYHKAFGLANREKSLPNKLTTKFDIGSMNKSFTKVLIMKMLENGQLKMEDKLGDILSGFQAEAAKGITVEMLLNHSSGIAPYFYPGYFDAPKKDKTIAALVERIKKKALLFPPGEEQEYSNAGYVVLGAIIEKLSGKPYTENVKEQILQPLSMTETYVEEVDKIKDRAIGYFKNYKGDLQNNTGFVEIPKPDGGFQSTTRDILRFYQAYFYGEELWSDELKQMDALYPYLQKFKENGQPMAYAGGYEGANTVYFENLRDKISVMVFANMDEPVAEQLGAGILDLIKGEEAPKPHLPAVQNVFKAYKKSGIKYVENNFKELTLNFHATDPRDMILNMLGYQLMRDKKVQDARNIFELNTRLFPEVPNVWDSLGEVCLKLGDKINAKKYYEKALSLDPEMESAQHALRKMK